MDRAAHSSAREGSPELLDALIIGGGPAGMSAALVLGRCCRRVLLCDAGHPRSERSRGVHAFLSRDGILPAEFRALCRAELASYPNIELVDREAVAAAPTEQGFQIELRGGRIVRGRALLLATGIVDELPSMEGFMQFYGSSAHHCPICDGWEHRGQSLAVLGGTSFAKSLAIELRCWSADVILCTNAEKRLTPTDRDELRAAGIPVREEEIAALEGHEGQLTGIRFRDGEVLARQALFFSPAQRQRCLLGESLGCEFHDDGCTRCGPDLQTRVPGVFAAGNSTRGLQLAIVAAAEGAQAGFTIHEYLEEKRAGHSPACPQSRT